MVIFQLHPDVSTAITLILKSSSCPPRTFASLFRPREVGFTGGRQFALLGCWPFLCAYRVGSTGSWSPLGCMKALQPLHRAQKFASGVKQFCGGGLPSCHLMTCPSPSGGVKIRGLGALNLLVLPQVTLPCTRLVGHSRLPGTVGKHLLTPRRSPTTEIRTTSSGCTSCTCPWTTSSAPPTPPRAFSKGEENFRGTTIFVSPHSLPSVCL